MGKTAAVQAAETLDTTAVRLHEEARQRFAEAQIDWDSEMSRRRRILYTDVEDLVNTGFLSHQLRVGSANVSLRSLGPGDLFLLGHRCGTFANDRVWKTWVVATSIWMVDGMCLLEDPQAAHKVHQIIGGLPKLVIDIMVSLVMGLFNRVSTALMRTEAYCYEPYSRVGWRMCGRQIPSKSEISGIPGVGRLGMNHTQRMWLAFNLSEDDRDDQIMEWSAAKLVAGASNPKGVRKLNTSDEQLRKKEKQRRTKVHEQMIRRVLYGEEDSEEAKPWTVMVRGEPVEVSPVQTAKTDEELEDQFRRWVAGEKDWHDIVVDTYKDRIRDHYDEERQERSAALDRVVPGVSGTTHLVGYTLEQLKELRGDLAHQRPGGRRVFDDGAPVEVYKKYVAKDPESGRLRADESGVYEVPTETVEKATLQDQVSRRKPAFSTEPMGTPLVEGTD